MGPLSEPSGAAALVRFVAETGSTNADMKALALDGAPAGMWLRAGRQTAGRGRMGRDWAGEEGNLYASTLIRLLPTDPPPHTLALVIAVAVHRALSDYVGAQAIRIKWPNDIMAGAAKLSGMLLERAEDAIIIGIGVNVAHAPDLADRQAISLRELGAQSCDPAMLLEAIARYFEDGVRQWRSFGVEPVARNWQERAHATGTPLAAMLADGQRIEGRFASLDGDGALILRLADGRSHVIHAGDVFLI